MFSKLKIYLADSTHCLSLVVEASMTEGGGKSGKNPGQLSQQTNRVFLRNKYFYTSFLENSVDCQQPRARRAIVANAGVA